MEKRTGVILFLIFFVAFLQAENVKPDENDELLNLRLQEIHFNVTPSFKIVIPDASIKLGLEQKIGDTQLDAETEYNYVYNKINYNIKYGFDFLMTYYVKFYDTINFEQIYNINEKYIQRNKGIVFGIHTPTLFDYFQVKEELEFGNYYFARLSNTNFIPDDGNTIFLVTWFEFSDGFVKNNNLRDTYAGINFDKSIPSDFSFYNYLFLNVLAEKNFRFDSSTLQLKFKGGYLIENFSTPMWKVYRAGGFDKMIGYKYDEFQGFYENFFRIKYDFIIKEKINRQFLLLLFKKINGIIILDAGCAGSENDISKINSYKVGAGIGVKFEFIFRKRTPVMITLAIGQAMEADRYPVFYFVDEF
ncbi:MAG: hypothetical protein KA120_09470 [Candidatus Goldbacteria bacterium]|nr:hypothetical protein [Candidatus Goldiibacteriota bacterium]